MLRRSARICRTRVVGSFGSLIGVLIGCCGINSQSAADAAISRPLGSVLHAVRGAVLIKMGGDGVHLLSPPLASGDFTDRLLFPAAAAQHSQTGG